MAGDASASGGTVARDLLSEANIQLAGAAAGDNAGLSVAGAGDVNGDGVPDLLIGGAESELFGPVRVWFGLRCLRPARLDFGRSRLA